MLDIALAGFATTPTFAFVDRPSSFTEKDEKRPLAPGLSLLRDAVGDGLVASDAFGIVVQTTDLDAAPPFTEQSLLFAQAEEVSAAAAASAARERDPQKAVEGRREGLFWVHRRFARRPKRDRRSHPRTTRRSMRRLRRSTPCARRVRVPSSSRLRKRTAARTRGVRRRAVVCERGEVADRIYWIESAVVVVETGGRVTEETEETFFPKEEGRERTNVVAADVRVRRRDAASEHVFPRRVPISVPRRRRASSHLRTRRVRSLRPEKRTRRQTLVALWAARDSDGDSDGSAR